MSCAWKEPRCKIGLILGLYVLKLFNLHWLRSSLLELLPYIISHEKKSVMERKRSSGFCRISKVAFLPFLAPVGPIA